MKKSSKKNILKEADKSTKTPTPDRRGKVTLKPKKRSRKQVEKPGYAMESEPTISSKAIREKRAEIDATPDGDASSCLDESTDTVVRASSSQEVPMAEADGTPAENVNEEMAGQHASKRRWLRYLHLA